MGSTFTNGAYLVLDRTVRVVRLLDQLIFELLARGFICVCLGLVMYRRSRVTRGTRPVVGRGWKRRGEGWRGHPPRWLMGREGSGGELRTCAALFFPLPRVRFIALQEWPSL